MSEATFDRAAEALVVSERRRPAAEPSPQPATSVRRRHMDPLAATLALPRGDLSEFQRWFRHWFSRTVSALVMKSWFRITVVGRERLSREPAIYCFNHLSWTDPLALLGVFPSQPRLHFYGPEQADLRPGRGNRFMWWTTIPVPFSPLRNDLLTSVRWAQAVFDSGGALAISPEGTIHVHEGDLLPFEEGAAYLALRAGVPIIPVAITGTSWAHFRGRVLIRIGEPIATSGRPTRQAVARYTALTWHALRAMVDGDRDLPVPGRFERWFTDLFNDWGPGGRQAATERRGPEPADVPIPAIRAVPPYHVVPAESPAADSRGGMAAGSEGESERRSALP
jgi:1-acyl-sn-glycerol-3-phosphate acyltransferase